MSDLAGLLYCGVVHSPSSPPKLTEDRAMSALTMILTAAMAVSGLIGE
jgi:hypothetical protein